MAKPRTVDELLHEARASLRRMSPADAERAASDGALIVDIRPLELRVRDGVIPGALAVGRNVLEWRLDPASPYRLPEATSHEQTVVVVCDEGYASSFAAASLQQLGLHHATDLIGGFRSWKAAGLPIERFPA
jgi:rhodanese-related sulfurtransferase